MREITYKGTKKSFLANYPHKDDRNFDTIYIMDTGRTKTMYHFVGSLEDQSFKPYKPLIVKTHNALEEKALQNMVKPVLIKFNTPITNEELEALKQKAKSEEVIWFLPIPTDKKNTFFVDKEFIYSDAPSAFINGLDYASAVSGFDYITTPLYKFFTRLAMNEFKRI